MSPFTLKKIRLEHRKQKVIPLPHFLLRLGRYFLFCGLLISLSLLVGTLGYMFFGKLNWVDGFHMSSMILTGMGPVADMSSTSAKLFSSFYALYSGIAFLSTTAIFLAPVFHRVLHILQVETSDQVKK